jgi:Protein of unknown function (DUF1236)
MKIHLSIINAALSVSLLGPGARAQAPSDQPPVVATPTVNLTVENRHVIKEIIKDLHVQSVASDVKVDVGAAVPQSVALQPMPARVAEKVPQVKSHEFFVQNDKIALVDPKNHKIVEVIE